MEDMVLWFKSQRLKDNEEIVKSKLDFINTIKEMSPEVIKNTIPEVKKYTLWQRLKKVLWNN